MKFIKPIIFLILLVVASQVYSQVPPEPGKAIPATTVKSNVKQKGPGGNPPDPGATPPVPVPLDGGLLLALLASGSVSALFFKKKNKEKE